MREHQQIENYKSHKDSKDSGDGAREHSKWRSLRNDRKCTDYYHMSYWQMKTTCTIL